MWVLGGLGVQGSEEGCVAAVQGQPVQGEAGRGEHESPWGECGARRWAHTWVACTCRGVRSLSRAEGSSQREEGAALGRLTPWWSPRAEAVSRSSVAGTWQASGV